VVNIARDWEQVGQAHGLVFSRSCPFDGSGPTDRLASL
jgi:hypothetical protein